MAYANWITLDKTSGYGDATVKISVNSQNPGRDERHTQITIKAQGCSDVVIPVSQDGKPTFTTFNSSTMTIGATDESCYIYGKSNSEDIIVTLQDNQFIPPYDNIHVEVKPAGHSSYDSGCADPEYGPDRWGGYIAGDPGAYNDYDFRIYIAMLEPNTTSSPKTAKVIVTNEEGQKTTCIVTQSASGVSYLSAEPDDIEIGNASGDYQNINISSNTNWTIS